MDRATLVRPIFLGTEDEEAAIADTNERYTVAEEEAPSGMLARGHYNAISRFVDDDNKTHLEFEWSFDIAKDW